MTIDVGTGDGRAVLAAAAGNPETLVLGLDASAAAMSEASRRAARPARKGGHPNARFVVAAAEALPDELAGVADLVTVQFPWGSLLRGMLGHDDAVACGVASLLGPSGTLKLLVAPAARDGLDGIPTDPTGVIAAAATTFAAHRLELLDGKPATAEEVAKSGSTWARRLLSGGGEGRSVLQVRLKARPA